MPRRCEANKWIKKMEEPNKLAVKKFTDSDYIRRLEAAILGYFRLFQCRFDRCPAWKRQNIDENQWTSAGTGVETL